MKNRNLKSRLEIQLKFHHIIAFVTLQSRDKRERIYVRRQYSGRSERELALYAKLINLR